MTESGHEHPHVINSDEARDEWILFKQLISKNYRGCILQSMATKLLQSDVVKDQHPNMLTLITLVDCERGFSKHNLVKTRIRGRLKTHYIAKLMKMSIDTPELS